MKREEITKENLNKMSKDEVIDVVFSLMDSMDKVLKGYQDREQQYLEMINSLNRNRFGKKTEQTSDIVQPSLFNELEKEFDDASQEELDNEDELVEVVKKRPGKRRGHRKNKETDYEALPHTTVHVTLDEKDCPECGRKLKEFGTEIKYVLVHIPEQYKVIKYVIHKYHCPNCDKNSDDFKVYVNEEKLPHRIIEGSVVDASVISGIAVNKYVLGTPYYRQEKDLKQRGIPITRQNMSNWLMKCSDMYLKYLVRKMRLDANTLDILNGDETPEICLEANKDGQRSKSYVWVVMSGKWEEKQMALYAYRDNRRYETAAELYKDFHGALHSDGYEGYHRLDCTNIGCMTHMRRRFVDAMQSDPIHSKMTKLDKAGQKELLEKYPGYRNILEILALIGKLYAIEDKLKKSGAKPEEIYKTRQSKSKPIFDELFACITKHKDDYSQKGKMGTAIAYALNQKQYIEKYLTDGRYEIDNNRAEREGIKPFVINRKNFLFSNTKSGAEATMVYMSLIVSAQMNNLDPDLYLQYVLNTMAQNPMTDELIESLLPYSKSLPDNIKSKNPRRS